MLRLLKSLCAFAVCPLVLAAHRLQARRPQLQPPRLQRPPAYKETGASRWSSSAQSRRRRLAAGQPLRRHVERQVVGDLPGPAAQPAGRAHRPQQRAACARRWKPTSPRATRCAAARANLYPTLSAGPSISRNRDSANRPLTPPAAPTSYNDFVARRPGQLGAGFLGPHPPHRGSRRARTRRPAPPMRPTSALTLHAEMAADYFALRGLDSQIKLLTATVADLRTPARPDPAPLCRRRGHRGGRGPGANAA